MIILLLRRSAIPLAIGLLTIHLSGCVVGGGYGYDGDPGVGVGVGYYEPYGGVYGGWGSGYQVGPYRDGGGSYRAGGGAHAYRAARGSRSMPSIPSGSRHGR